MENLVDERQGHFYFLGDMILNSKKLTCKNYSNMLQKLLIVSTNP